MYKNRIYYGLIYQNSLANKVMQLGCEIENVGPNGLWEIKGIPKEARDIMSKRRKQIEEGIDKLNYRSLKSADIAALDTREKKPENLNLNEIKSGWSSELASVGFSSKDFISKLHEKEKRDINNQDKEKTYNIVKQTAKEAINDSIEYLSQYNLKLDYAKIISKALEYTIGKNTHLEMINALGENIKDGNLIPLDKNSSMFVTKNLIETEKNIMEMVSTDKEKPGKILAIKLKNKEVEGINSGEAKDIAINILQSPNRLNLVESGIANNTEFASAILKLAESAGKTVRILSPNRMMTNSVNENIKRKPNSLWKWLVSLSKPELGESIAGFKHKHKMELSQPFSNFRKGKDVIVIDSAETIGCKDMESLLELTDKSNAKLIFLENINYKKGVIAGNSITTLKSAGIKKFELSSEKKKIEYIPELREIKDSSERTKQLALSYASKGGKERADTIVFLGSKDKLKSTNEAIRAELKNQWKLSSVDRNISVLNPIYMSKPDSELAHIYQKHMIIRFYDDNRLHDDWKIESINKEKNTLRLIKGKKRIVWNPRKQEKNCSVFKQEKLLIAKGDKLKATANMKNLRIRNGSTFTVHEINDKHIKLVSGSKTTRIPICDLENSHFQYNYATTLSMYSKKQVAHAIADIREYALDKATINMLTDRARESLTIFTNNADTAQKRFNYSTTKFTGTDVILDASKIDRFINDNTVLEIKNDVEKAITALSNRYNLLENSKNKAVNFAVEKITSHNAGFTHKELVAEALKYALNEEMAIKGNAVTHNDIMHVIKEKRDSGELIIGKHFSDGTRWTTKEILEQEKSIIHNVGKGSNTLEAMLDDKKTRDFLETSNLTKDQKNACHSIVTSRDKFIVIQGYAGTGKTTMLSSVQNMLNKDKNIQLSSGSNRVDKEKMEVLGLAPTHQAVEELKKVGINAQTLKSFLVEQRREIRNYGLKNDIAVENVDKKTTSNNISSLNNKLIILDEASMVSNKEFVEFIDIVKDIMGQIVFSGDRAQHISIGGGKPFEMIQISDAIKKVYLYEIIRQKNPILKGAVKNTIEGNYSAAFEKIFSMNPKNHIERKNSEISELLKLSKNSIVEIDNNKLKKGEKTIEEAVAEDYLSRTPETRGKTVVIVHANKDRKVITGFIRDGLKKQGEISQKGKKVSCLVPKGLTDVEHKSLQAYNQGDVVKFGKDYYHVVQNEQLSKSVILKDADGKTKYFYPEKYVDRYNVELYEHTKAELAVGDVIRLTKTDKERELYANFEYKVKDVKNDAVSLESTCVNSKDSKGKSIVINPKELKDAHWDYAQTVTGYGIQGGSRKFAIDLELSYRKNLANLRSFYIAISRAIEHLVIYTDDKCKLLSSICANKGDKYAALEVVGDLSISKNTDFNEKYNKSEPTKKSKQTKQPSREETKRTFYDAKEVKQSLNNSAEFFVEKLLGSPNNKLSSASEWRYGNKGSLAITMAGEKRGLWHNFETGESGNLLTLIQNELGLSFKEALAYVPGVLGKANFNDISKQSQTNQKKVDNASSNHEIQRKSKTSEYAKKLAAESVPIFGTIAEKYLKDTRGINDPNSNDIRYHPKVYIGKNEKDNDYKYSPAMLSIGRDKQGNIQCVQATYLNPKTADKEKFNINKRTYSSPSGAMVTLQKNESNKLSLITEGVETGLSIKDAVKNGDVMVTLGKSNLINIEVQKLNQRVVLCLDNDGAKSLNDATIHKAAQRLVSQGKEVFIAIPDQINGKTDFNDVGRMKGINAVKSFIDRAIPYNKFLEKTEFNNNKIDYEFGSSMYSKHSLKSEKHSDNSIKNSSFSTKTPDSLVQSVQTTPEIHPNKDKRIELEI